MNVLSLFDGISCGQLALQRAGIKVDNYFSSEIDSYAVKVTQYNFPTTVQLGNATKININKLPKIDLLMGGSPCQGFSLSGKQLNFEDPRSGLFFEFCIIKKKLNPKYFLLENVKMKKDYENIISFFLQQDPIEINSSLVSAQDRKRMYWTNIPIAFLPTNKEIHLIDILEKEVDETYFLKESVCAKFSETKNYILNKKKSCVVGELSKYQGDRVFDINGKGRSLLARGGNNGGGSCNIILDKNRLRRLVPVECERLQTLPDNYTCVIPQTKRYEVLGNGWTVDVVAHIFKGIIETI